MVRGVFDRTRPPLSVPVHERIEDGARLLVISVPRGAVLYANAKGTSTRRVGVECRPFPPEEQRQALAARGTWDFSAETVDVGVGAVSAEEMERLRGLLVRAGRDDAARLDDVRLLRDLRLLDGDLLTRAGLLLLGREPDTTRHAPTYGYSYIYRSSGGSEATARIRERRPVLAAIEQLLDAVATRRTVHPINTSGGVQIQLFDYGSTVVRELVINALVHRDYQFDGSVDIEHNPDQLAVSSPGALIFGVTPDNILTHPSTPRNRLLLETLTGLQFAERAGQGVDRVYRDLLSTGKPPPRFDDDGTRVVVTVSGGTGNDAFARFVNVSLDRDLAVDIDVLLALAMLRESRLLAAPTLAPALQRPPVEAQQVLDRLARSGLVEATRRTARSPFPNYALVPTVIADLGRAVTYARRSGDGMDQKVVAHVTEYGFITNQTLRRMFDLTVYAARDVLKDLQRRGLLTKLDAKSSGPGVRYGRGHRFPGKRVR